MSEKSTLVAYILWLFLGIFGVHRFYLGRPISGIVWLLTGGLFGIGWLLDLCLIPGMVQDCNDHHTTTIIYGNPNHPPTVIVQQPYNAMYSQPQYPTTYNSPPPFNPGYQPTAPP